MATKRCAKQRPTDRHANPEKLNLSQICAAFAPVLQLNAANLAALGVPFEKDRSAVLMNARDLPRLADALIDQLYAKRDEFLAGPAPRAPAIPAPAIQHLPADDTEGGAL